MGREMEVIVLVREDGDVVFDSSVSAPREGDRGAQAQDLAARAADGGREGGDRG